VAKAPGNGGGEVPCPTGPDKQFTADSPFEDDGKNYQPPVVKEGKRIWANSFLWADAPKLEVEKWLSEVPDTKGKYVLLEFWATWCGPCRRSIPLLNKFHARFKDELVVIGISDETEPSAPTPTTATRDRSKPRCPSSPISSKRIWRE